MKVAFTTATINYLPRAFTLAASFLDHNPGYDFTIFLIDPLDERIRPFEHERLKYISIGKIPIEALAQMQGKLNISEISFSLKPMLAEYLLIQNPDIEHLFYLDGDTRVYQPLSHAEELFEEYNLLLTPHFTHPIQDHKLPRELDILRTGLYNMGFAGFKNTENTLNILAWWKKRVLEFGYENHDLGLSADQMWMSLSPLFFKNVGLITHPGYNFAYWNVHERNLSHSNGTFWVNETSPLVFVHFADFDPGKPELFSNPKHFTRIEPGENSALDKLCSAYAEELKLNHLETYKNFKSEYSVSYAKQAWKNFKLSKSSGDKLKYLLIRIIYMLPKILHKGLRSFSLFILRNIK